MDALDGNGNDSLDAEVHRTNCSMFAAGSLPVGGAGNDEVVLSPILILGASLAEVLVDRLKDILGIHRYVRAVLEAASSRHDMVGGNLIPHLDGDIPLQVILEGCIFRGIPNIGTSENLNIRTILGRKHEH
ncbi:hypothetical protein SDC9_149634 [bioreactor metagenome]|uniref:Uncharacterized protein n=1 Tax=bioreactor metagenome TaxID=1076179 RepID=A0A645EK79_9ZZZZ